MHRTQTKHKAQISQNTKVFGFWILCLCALFVIWFLGFVSFVYAQTQYNLIEPLPNIQSVKDFPDFVSRFIPFLLAFAALAAFVQIVFGGILRATSGGNPTAIGDANNRIWMAIGGLVLALSAYLILNTINPDLVSLRFLVPPVRIEGSKNTTGTIAEGQTCTRDNDCTGNLKCKKVTFKDGFINKCLP